jgi:hypothetical protein
MIEKKIMVRNISKPKRQLIKKYDGNACPMITSSVTHIICKEPSEQ